MPRSPCCTRLAKANEAVQTFVAAVLAARVVWWPLALCKTNRLGLDRKETRVERSTGEG